MSGWLLPLSLASACTLACSASHGDRPHAGELPADHAAATCSAGREKFFGQEAPGSTPQIFAPGIVSLPDVVEMYCSVSPDNREFFFRRNSASGESMIMVWRSDDARGQSVQRLSFSPHNRDFQPYCTPDGKSLLFHRLPPRENFERDECDTWIVDRSADGWGEPRILHKGYCLTWSLAGEAFFTSSARPNSDIMTMQLADGRFSEPRAIERGINTEHREGHSFVSADGSMLLFDSDRPGGYGGVDVYASFRRADGSWGEPRNLGPQINDEQNSWMASITADGRFIFFSAHGDIWWVGAVLLDELRAEGK